MDMVSVPVVDPTEFMALKQQAKSDLTRDSNLDKAADLTAQRNALLMNEDVPPALKRAQLKVLNRKVAHWTKKVRQPFGTSSQVGEVGPTETDVSPTQNMIKALITTIKSAPEESPVIPRAKRRPVDDLTPVPTPATRPAKKKAKQALGAVSTPLSAPLTPPTRPRKSVQASASPALEPADRSRSVAKGKQLTKKYLQKKGKDAAKKAAKDAAKKWLDF